MGILDNRDWSNARIDQRILAKTIACCTLGEIREEDPRDTKSGPATAVVVPLTLEEAKPTIDGETVNPGFPVTGRIRWFTAPNLPENLAKANEMSDQRLKQLVVAALGMKRNTKENVGELLKTQGGWPALAGRKVLVSFDVTESNGSKFQELASFSAFTPKPGATAAPANPY